MKKIKAFVISHGHMDIEWYQPLRSYRFWQVEALDRLVQISKDDPDMVPYTIDGQVYPLEEYLDVRPEKEKEIRDLILNGKLNIGPFYTQFDEWLPSGESMARNCLYGNRLSNEYGGILNMGYLPDNFGHPLQLPQLLNNFGIDSLVFMRGMPYVTEDYPDEFLYQGLDSSKLTSINFRNSYSNLYRPAGEKVETMLRRDTPYYEGYLTYEWHTELAAYKEPEKTAELMIKAAREFVKYAPSNVVPIVVGSDHCPPQSGLSNVVKIANEMQDEIEFITGNPADYIRMVQKESPGMPVLDQELIGTRFQYILLGALSTRSYLKCENFAAETLLEKYAEPLEAISRLNGHSGWQGLLDESWRNLMTNHAHDSIHGSSVDEVHVEMLQRFDAVKQTAAGIIHDTLKFLADRVNPWWKGNRSVITFTPTAAAPHLCDVWLPIGNSGVELLDQNGNTYKAQVLPNLPGEDNGRGKPNLLVNPGEPLRRVLFEVDAKAGEFQTFACVLTDKEAETTLRTGEDYIENDYLRVTADGATIKIDDKVSGRSYYDLNLLVEQADAGDYWDTSPTWQPSETVLSNRFDAAYRIVEHGPVRACMVIEGEMSVPKNLKDGKRSRERVMIPYTFEVFITRTARRVDVRLTLENNAKDHKILLHYAPGIKTDSVSCATAFGTLKRPVVPAAVDGECVQPPTRIFPFREWLALEDEKQGLALAAKGIYSYESFEDPQTREAGAYLSLLRGVGDMGRINMKMRKGAASSSFASYSAQCPGKQVFEFSYIPYDADKDSLPFIPQVNAYLYPTVGHLIRGCTVDNTVAAIAQPYSWDCSNVLFSAFKYSYDGDGYILRFFENEGKACKLTVQVPVFKSVFLSNMNEETKEPLEQINGAVTLEVKPFEIVTLKLDQ